MIKELSFEIPSPICFYVYNRPEHTKESLDYLSRAKLAESSTLYIYCDGPKEVADTLELDKIRQVRDLVLSESRFKEVIVTLAQKNIGLGKSIISGINKVLNNHDTVIVLEDDILVHPDFLIFMNYNLQVYRNYKEVMHISAFQRNSWVQFFLPNIFFSRFMDCWGWATWSDRWSLLITDVSTFDKFLSLDKNKTKFNFGVLEHSNQFNLNREGLQTWAIFWYATIVMLNGLCLRPRFSYTKNIGNDGSGTNGVVKTTELASNFVKRFKPYKPRLIETRLSELYIQEAYAKRSKKRLTTPKRWLHDILSNLRNSLYKPTL